MVFFRTPRVAVEPSREYLNDLELRLRETFNRISTQPVSGGGGITKLSQLGIDDDKDWADRSINHLHSIAIQPDLLPADELDTILIQHSDKTFKTLFNVFTDDIGITHTQNFLKFSLSDYDLLLGIEHVYKRAPLPIDYYHALMTTGLDVGFSMNSLGITAYNGFTVYGSYNSLTTPDLEFDLSTNAELTFYGENQNFVISGRSTNLFRVQDMGSPERHVVDSIYHDDTYNLDIVGTRWAMRIGEVDYHIGLGLTYDNTNGIMHSGLISYLNDFEIYGKYETGVGIYNYGIGISKEWFIYPQPFGDRYNFALIYGIDELNQGYTGQFGIGFSSSRRAFTEQHLRYVFYEKKEGGEFVDVGMILLGDITGIGHYTWKLNTTEGMFFSTNRSVWLQGEEFMWLRLVNEAIAIEYGGVMVDYIDYGYGYAEVYGQYGYLEFTNTDINLYSDTLNFNVIVGGDIVFNPAGVINFSQKQSTNFVLQNWTTATRPSNPVEGQIGYNTDTHQFEGWNGSSWVILG
jgi:hypothetical protein